LSNGREAPAARGGGTNTLNTRTVPIIVVPGVMGTRLQRPGGGAFWDPDNRSSMVSLLAASAGIGGIMLHADTAAEVMRTGSRAAALTPEETERGWGGPAWSFYGAALRMLQDATHWGGILCNVYAFGYDWRQSNADSGRLLQSRISSILRREE
jgi:hypothetical protein